MRKFLQFRPLLIVAALFAGLWWLLCEDETRRLPYIAAEQSLRKANEHLERSINTLVGHLAAEVDRFNISDSLYASIQSLAESTYSAQSSIFAAHIAIGDMAGRRSGDIALSLAAIADFYAPVKSVFLVEQHRRLGLNIRHQFRQMRDSIQHIALRASAEIAHVNADSIRLCTELLPINDELSDDEWLEYHFAQRGAGEAILLLMHWRNIVCTETYATLLHICKKSPTHTQRLGLFCHTIPRKRTRETQSDFLRVGDTLDLYAWVEGYDPQRPYTIQINRQPIDIIDGVGKGTISAQSIGEQKTLMGARLQYIGSSGTYYTQRLYEYSIMPPQ